MTSRSDTGVWLTPSDGRRWRLYPGALSLAFGCSGDFGYNVDAWETLRKPAGLAVPGALVEVDAIALIP